MTVGFAFCGSFCTYNQVFPVLEKLAAEHTVIPIFSEASSKTDSRFGTAIDFLSRTEKICGMKPCTKLSQVEPIGPKKLLDLLIVAPCTGNTLAKIAAGITDTPAALAVKSHLRNGRPVLIAVSTNDGLGQSAKNLGALLPVKGIYFVPFWQDDCIQKPNSLVANFALTTDAAVEALQNRQLQPVLRQKSL